MTDAYHELITHIAIFLLVCALVLGLSKAAKIGVMYLQTTTTSQHIESFIVDMLEYGAMHDGFNDPTENSQKHFQDVVDDYKRRYKLVDTPGADQNVQSITFTPAPSDISYKGRSATLTIEVVPIYPDLKIIGTGKRVGKVKKGSAVTHGYVKTMGEKEYNYDGETIAQIDSYGLNWR